MRSWMSSTFTAVKPGEQKQQERVALVANAIRQTKTVIVYSADVKLGEQRQ